MSDYILRCITCKAEYKSEVARYTCDKCDSINGTLEVIYDYEKIKTLECVKNRYFSNRGSMYQYDFLLPTKSKCVFDDHIGGTPLYKFEDLLGMDHILIKYDGSNPSSSYKDRASTIAINKALDEGQKTMFCASTGNAAASLAMLNAHTHMDTVIFVPSSIPKGKRIQLEVSGARIMAVDCTYDEVFDLSLEIGLKKGWYTRHSAINPYLLEGKKTGAFEIIVQNNYQVPDYVIVGVGDGTVISGICKGFEEFKKIGIIDRIPVVIGVQASGIPGVKKVFDKGRPYKPSPILGQTIADSIAVGNPRDVIKACEYVARTKGYFVEIDDEAIVEAIKSMGATTGIFAEPAGAVSYGGLKKLIAMGKIKQNESVCIVVTGNGLKDLKAIEGDMKTTTYTIKQLKERFGEQ